MPEIPPYEELQAQIDAALMELAEADELEVRAAPSAPLTSILRTTLLALSASMGECRQALPYSPMHPVRTASGELRWCCNHQPEHCGEETA